MHVTALLAFAGVIAVSLLAVLGIPAARRRFLVRPVFLAMRRSAPKVSATERQALAAGVGFDGSFFRGEIDWQRLRAVPPIRLTPQEQAFLDGPTGDLCRKIDDWAIRHNREIPEEIWSFLKQHGFFGLRISTPHGGIGLSPQALSLVFGKIASRSLDVFSIVMIPNSLGVGELIERYGMPEQKQHHLPRLARGDDIPCFALSGPTTGSDAAGMPDIGVVTMGTHGGERVLGARVSWDKRSITVSARATLLGLAFRLVDPDRLLGKETEVGMTMALVPADHPGVKIGRCHLPAGAAFPTGPTWGKDVFIPLAWIIGGEPMAGQGWRMLMECVSGSRAVALPACAAGGAKALLRFSTAYARIRKQFGRPLARIEGLEEPLARMIETAYVVEAGRAVVAAMAGEGEVSPGLSALIKYQSTARARRALEDAMDLHGGRAIFDGQANYLQSFYQASPIAVTIEGANILSRSLLTFLPAALRAHPYLQREIEACADADARRGLAAFEPAFLGHVSFTLGNAARAWFHNLTGGAFARVPAAAPAPATARWQRQLARACRSFAFVADVMLVLLGGRLRSRQKLAGRLADALSELCLLACTLKRHEDDGAPADDLPIVAFAMQNGLWRFQEALRGTIDNVPVPWARMLMRAVVFPLGARSRPAPDRLGHAIVELAVEQGAVRDRLTRHIYVSDDANDPTGLLEAARTKAIDAAEADRKLERAIRQGLVRRQLGLDSIAEAVSKEVVTAGEAELLRAAEALATRAIAVDHFDPDEVRPNYMKAGHNTRAMRDAAAE